MYYKGVIVVMDVIQKITARQPLRTAKFGEIGRHAGGGLRNGDLLIASKVRSIRFTDDKRRPHKFRLAAHLGSTFWVTKGGTD